MAKEFSGIDVIRRENTKALMSEAVFYCPKNYLLDIFL